MVEILTTKSNYNAELSFTLECTRSISWKIFLDEDALVFSDNFEAMYGIHQADYGYRFGKFLDRHLNPHKDQILESIDLYFSGEADNIAIGEISILDGKNKLNWAQASGKCIYDNKNVIYGVTVDITESKEQSGKPEQKKDESGLQLLMLQLTKREREVINAVLDGHVCYKDLSAVLNISQNTVKTHIKNIYQAADVSSIPALLTFLHSSL